MRQLALIPTTNQPAERLGWQARPVFEPGTYTGVSKKTAENSERLGQHVRSGIKPTPPVYQFDSKTNRPLIGQSEFGLALFKYILISFIII